MKESRTKRPRRPKPASAKGRVAIPSPKSIHSRNLVRVLIAGIFAVAAAAALVAEKTRLDCSNPGTYMPDAKDACDDGFKQTYIKRLKYILSHW